MDGSRIAPTSSAIRRARLQYDCSARRQGGGGGKSEAVEFFFPFASLRCYDKYDCTGQQLLDAGAVLINGERVALDLQIAGGGPGH
ncbi:MAG TPA: hypothetical protein VN868_04595 [Terriglobales bacterium]|jgi:hypothetical protein|nr:hypothetical protein [Terriglobales bacterium]